MCFLNSTTFTNLLSADPESSQSYAVPHHVLEAWRSLLQPEVCHWCDWGDDQGPDKIGQQTHCCPLQRYSDSQWNVLCHCKHHWEMQDRGGGGCVPGRQDSTSTETRGCAHCGELERKKGELARKKLCRCCSFNLQDDYTLIFDAVLVFLKSFESYANFQ